MQGKNALQFAVEGQRLEAVKRSLPQPEASASSSDETNSMVVRLVATHAHEASQLLLLH